MQLGGLEAFFMFCIWLAMAQSLRLLALRRQHGAGQTVGARGGLLPNWVLISEGPACILSTWPPGTGPLTGGHRVC